MDTIVNAQKLVVFRNMSVSTLSIENNALILQLSLALLTLFLLFPGIFKNNKCGSSNVGICDSNYLTKVGL